MAGYLERLVRPIGWPSASLPLHLLGDGGTTGHNNLSQQDQPPSRRSHHHLNPHQQLPRHRMLLGAVGVRDMRMWLRRAGSRGYRGLWWLLGGGGILKRKGRSC